MTHFIEANFTHHTRPINILIFSILKYNLKIKNPEI